MLAPHKEANLDLRHGYWLYIGAQGVGGFGRSKPGSKSLDRIGALKFTGEINWKSQVG
jgi:arylsulfatase A